MWTDDFKVMVLLAAVLGLALGALLAYLDTVRAEQEFVVFVYGRDEVSPADISLMHEEVRRIQASDGENV
jgi:hypothetical protein